MYSKNLLIEKTQLAGIDAAVVFGSALIATWLRHGLGLLGPGQGSVPWLDYLPPAALIAGVFVVLFHAQGLYHVQCGALAEAVRIARAGGIATLLVLATTFFYREQSYSRATVVLFYPLALGAVLGARSLYRVYRRAVMKNRAAARRALIVGFGAVGQHLARALLARPAYYELVGFMDDAPECAGAALEGVPVLGTTAELAELVRRHEVDEVIVAIPSAPTARIMQLVGECLRHGVHFKVVPGLCELMLERVHVDHVGGLPLLGLRGSRIVGFNWASKRIFDVAVAALVLLLLSPLLLLITLALKLTSRGPVLYRQTRLGLAARPFAMLKFRSMRVASDPAAHLRYATDWIYGRTGGDVRRSLGAAAASVARTRVHKLTADPRITPVGRWLRRLSLDELPQLWNVLRGEMSVVGPRPPVPYEVERYTEWHKRRLAVLPGITGLWQVSGRNRLSFEEMVRLDLDYIENWSLSLDVKIVLRTLPVMIAGRAY